MAKKDDPLAEYNAKRDFSRTKEPAGKAGKSGKDRIFMVQKHDATRLHWDLRLEADGVLKSWAVTKGPSPDPDIKRLAVRTEDHPMDYATFEGTIPANEYGGGTVMLWDRGTWHPIEGKSADDIEEGHLHFVLDGERMKGEWLLIRMKPKKGEKRENWLLRKLDDEHAQEGDALVEKALTSVDTGRSMAEIAAGREPDKATGEDEAVEPLAEMKHARRGKKAGKPPKFAKPQLATLVDEVPTGNGWMHEIKFDGYRALIAVAGDKVTVWTRNQNDWTEKFGPLVEAIAALDLPPALIDGEIIALDKNGNPDFSTLQSVLKRGHGAQGPKDKLAFFAFDLLEVDGEDLTGHSNIERKERLEALLSDAEPPIHVADHIIGAGEKLYAQMCGAGQEGIIAKRIDAPYRHSRTKSWVKVKCVQRQEFIIVGWSESSAKARPFASLLLATKDGEDLIYRGKVGTGFDSEDLDRLGSKLDRIERKTPPLDVPKADARKAHWVTPNLVAEIAYAELTAEGRVRHASFLGLRQDKEAKDVGDERKNTAPSPSASVEISSRDRVIFPDSGETKGDLADYYEAIAPLMLPFATERPLSLVRCPQGRAKKCFFQKHDNGGFGDGVKAVPIKEKDGGTEDYLFVSDARGLLQCVQMGTIEFHGWGARTGAVEKPDRMVFDLDPDEGLDFADVREAAMDLRKHLADIGLTSFAMVTGGKGVHVVVPLTPGHSWDTHKSFSERFAKALAQAEPDRFTATMSKAKRKGRIFIDWLRNQRGSTAVMPYSARAREGAPVAAPVAWNELKKLNNARGFTIGDAKRLHDRAQSKTLAGWGFADQRLPDV
ncbi:MULTISPECIES: DNA ligase D [Citromicrobium]|uniref:DNA ligase D n=1 Tax=Citromicrobium TaxID=72173 RepID=UPI0001DD0D95|nr:MULTISPECIES: DNA ligase D [Citromicrobium]ALG60545.1 ATP-dependent DNA ligase [Citromicrobium sp. JL477]KPM14481.1 ATP-dependent DNA ligase [Citromicrobium sp. JL1351]KPM19781.1 ATP-dependent DNA ligase [Citromicrobium sp. JL31]KPM22737.1 ATP-dependent DNA ligase [Citromicrobium sp. JL2201]